MNIQLSPEEFERFRNGDKMIFNRVFATGKDALIYFCDIRLKNRQDAEEVVDDVFIWLSNYDKSRIDTPKHLVNSLYAVARKKTIDRLRKDQPHKNIFASDLNDEIIAGPKGDDLLDEVETEVATRILLLRKEIEKLPRKRREVMRLGLREGKNNTEIGALLNMSPSLVSQHKKNGFQSLLAALRKYGFYLWLLALFQKIF